MEKVIKPSVRSMAPMFLMFSLLIIIPLFPQDNWHKWVEFAKVSVAFFLVAIFTLGPILCFTRVKIDETKIVFSEWFGTKSALYSDIGFSQMLILATRKSPGPTLMVYGMDEKSVLMRVQLKNFSREDVRWLLSVPGLKVRK